MFSCPRGPGRVLLASSGLRPGIRLKSYDTQNSSYNREIIHSKMSTVLRLRNPDLKSCAHRSQNTFILCLPKRKGHCLQYYAKLLPRGMIRATFAFMGPLQSGPVLPSYSAWCALPSSLHQLARRRPWSRPGHWEVKTLMSAPCVRLEAASACGAISGAGLGLMSFGCQQLAFELSGALRPTSTHLLSDLPRPLLLQNPVAIARKLLQWLFIPHQANYLFSQDQDYILEGL